MILSRAGLMLIDLKQLQSSVSMRTLILEILGNNIRFWFDFLTSPVFLKVDYYECFERNSIFWCAIYPSDIEFGDTPHFFLQ